MIHHVKRVHDHTVKFVSEKTVKGALTHTSCAGFGIDFLHFLVEKSLSKITLLEHADKMWLLVREPVVGWAALAAVLVIYVDNHAKPKEVHDGTIP